MKTFDLFFVASDDRPVTSESILECLAGIPHLRQDASDPTRQLYHNPESGTVFHLLLDPEHLPPSLDDDEPDYADDELEQEVDVEEDFDDDEDDEEEDDVAPIDTPPLTVNIPLFHPSFFAREALQVVRVFQEHAGLQVIDPQEGGVGDGESGAYSDDELLESWKRTHAPIFAKIDDPALIQRWSTEDADRYSAYCRHRARLAEELADDAVDVPQLFAARHEGTTKSLCIWRSDRAVLLPKCDLVLLQRVREKRGLLRRRKVDELVVSGEKLWKILAPFSEAKQDPVPHLVLRRADPPPAQLQNDLDDLLGEPVDAARRTELAGVIDFDIPAMQETAPADTDETSHE
jgi:hypothetical protein